MNLITEERLKDRVKLQIFRDCKMLAKSPETIKNAQNIKNNYTKYSNVKHDYTQYIVAEIEFEQDFAKIDPVFMRVPSKFRYFLATDWQHFLQYSLNKIIFL